VNFETKTARELQAIAKNRVHDMPELKANGVRVFVPMPRSCPADATGCNWVLQNCAPLPYKQHVDTVIEAMRREFRMAE
jgi:hypothetical protein